MVSCLWSLLDLHQIPVVQTGDGANMVVEQDGTVVAVAQRRLVVPLFITESERALAERVAGLRYAFYQQMKTVPEAIVLYEREHQGWTAHGLVAVAVLDTIVNVNQARSYEPYFPFERLSVIET